MEEIGGYDSVVFGQVEDIAGAHCVLMQWRIEEELIGEDYGAECDYG